MKRNEYEKKLEEWEAQGYDVSGLREKWFPAKKSRKGSILRWLAISIVIIALAIVITGWQLSKTQTQAPELTTAPTPKPALTTASTVEPELASTAIPTPPSTPIPTPAPITATYILSGGPSEGTPIVVDDDLIVELNGEVVYHDDDKASSTIDPITFEASPDDSIHIMAIDVGGASELSGLYLHSNGKIYRITEGIPGSESSELVFYDESFTISSLPEVTLYVISGGTSALVPIVVDDDLTVEVNGKVIYQDDDKTASTIDPITFAARAGDTIHIVANNTLLKKELSGLYINRNKNSYKITDGVPLSEGDRGIFFDVACKTNLNGLIEIIPQIFLGLNTPEVNGLEVWINGAVTSEKTEVTRLRWDWGDGTSTDSFFPATHTYNEAGTYTVVVTAYDDIQRHITSTTECIIESIPD